MEEAHREGHPLVGTVYPTFDAAATALHGAARDDNYAIYAHRYKPDKATARRVVWVCNKHRRPEKNPSTLRTALTKRRATGSQRTNCPFSIAMKRVKGEAGSWIIESIKSDRSHQHNHPKAEGINDYAKYRTEILKSLEEHVKARFKAGDGPSKALYGLREEHPDAKNLAREDISNRFMQYRREEL